MNEFIRPGFPTSKLREILRRLQALVPGGIKPGSGGSRPDPDAQRARVQVAVMRRALEKSGVGTAPREGNRPPRDDADVHYLFRPGHALVREEDFDRLASYLEERGKDFPRGFDRERDRTESRVRGLVKVRLPRRNDEQDDVLATLAEVERDGILPPGSVTPDHALYVTVYGRFCPATEPEVPRTRRPWPPQARFEGDLPEDQKIRVTVVDTGLWQPAVGSNRSPWLEKDDVFADDEDKEQVLPAAIHEYAGHGTFVAGVISCLAPETHIDVEGALPTGGVAFEEDICAQLQDALEENRPQIISMSAGTHTRDNHDLLSFVLLAQNNELDETDDVLIVAAAGNDSSNDPVYPAAFSKDRKWVVSVGSVDPDKKVSDFSNYGRDWVTVYARGRNLVNAFPIGTYTCHEPPHENEVRQFDGLAQWSGTSFSTPIVTGLIAAEMRDNGLTARAAWDVVRKTAITEYDARIGEDIQIVGPLT